MDVTLNATIGALDAQRLGSLPDYLIHRWLLSDATSVGLLDTGCNHLGSPFTRRLFLAGTIGATTLGLAACGADNSTTGASQPTGAAGFPITLAGKEGTTTINAEPQRVIALGFQRDTDTALALGVTPIAITENSIFPNGIAPWVESELTEPKPEMLNTDEGIPFEQVAGLRPDLILSTDDYDLANNYSRLAQIASTLSYLEGPANDTWQQRTTLIGKALGRSEQAQKIITDIETQITQTAQAHPAFAGKTFSRFYAFQGEIRVILRGDPGVTIIEQLGLKLSPQVAALPAADTPGRGVVSLENLGVLEADVMLVSYTTPADRTFLESQQVFQELDAVKDGKYVRQEQIVAAALGFPSALSIPWGLDRTVTAIANVLE
jgi:iron complex transport system substrate-binding protein